MTSSRTLIAALALALTVTGLALAAPTDTARADDILPIARKAKKVSRHAGHDLLPKHKMKQLKSGTHKIHTVKGHQVHAKLRHGKIAGMHVKTPKGKVVPMKRQRSGHRVSLDSDDAEVMTVALSGQVTFIFSAPGIEIIISFPLDSVLGGDDDDVDA
jgi:hypothetical protein